MRVLVAPDKLKGCLSGPQAARAMAQGVERVAGGVAEPLALADGGEGTLDVLLAALGGELRSVEVTGASGARLSARFGWVDRGRTAVIESAEAIGLTRCGPDRRVLDATSFGVGELIRAALDRGAERILVGLGGSASNDGGAGAAQALGVVLDGVPRPARARDLDALRGVDCATLDARLSRVALIALCDVRSPLTGPTGASAVFAPQKGASEAEVQRLDVALARFAARFSVDPKSAGAGAAGGLGFGLAACGARLVPGADFVLDTVGFERRARAAELVLTAEGRLDAQSLAGKLTVRVGERSRSLGIPAVALAGRVEIEASVLAEHGLVGAFPIADGPLSEAESAARAAELLGLAAERVVRVFAAARPSS